MTRSIRIGAVGESHFIVTEDLAIRFGDESVPPVLSTPSLIWYLEHAAIHALQPALEAGEMSVGVVVHVEHLAPTPLGAEVTCRARVIFLDGASVTFQVEAHDGTEPIARGTHKRQILQSVRMGRRVRRKQSAQE
ncbi:MAG: hypothetical protein KDA60_03725 [Planctomycetales bacterium]|nr:hypothetical protein [Planctomycetales bacterium]